jgi:hypothetical protein
MRLQPARRQHSRIAQHRISGIASGNEFAGEISQAVVSIEEKDRSIVPCISLELIVNNQDQALSFSALKQVIQNGFVP